MILPSLVLTTSQIVKCHSSVTQAIDLHRYLCNEEPSSARVTSLLEPTFSRHKHQSWFHFVIRYLVLSLYFHIRNPCKIFSFVIIFPNRKIISSSSVPIQKLALALLKAYRFISPPPNFFLNLIFKKKFKKRKNTKVRHSSIRTHCGRFFPE